MKLELFITIIFFYFKYCTGIDFCPNVPKCIWEDKSDYSACYRKEVISNCLPNKACCCPYNFNKDPYYFKNMLNQCIALSKLNPSECNFNIVNSI